MNWFHELPFFLALILWVIGSSIICYIFLHFFEKIWARYFSRFSPRWYLIVGLLLAIGWNVFTGSQFTLVYRDQTNQSAIAKMSEELEFVIWKWEVREFTNKLNTHLIDLPSYLPEKEDKRLVMDYMAQVSNVTILTNNQEILSIEDPNGEMMQEVTENLTAERARRNQLKPFAEDVLEIQMSEMLLKEGFGVGGGIYPPLLTSVSELPTMLIVSPRDRIEQIYGFPLKGSLSPAERLALEDQVKKDLNLSAIVTDIGGLGLYPAMVIETSWLPYLVDVIGHEWSHNWMIFRPIGYEYLEPSMRTVNETTASLFGQGVSERMIEQYYPEFLPQETVAETTEQETEPVPTQTPDPNEPPPFDFYTTMGQVRVQVDEYLAKGQIEQAETYMNEQRLIFLENGYQIRTLNQAYFAFHGAYAANPIMGAAGPSNPIGSKIQEIYKEHPNLRAFMRQMSPIGSVEELNAVSEE